MYEEKTAREKEKKERKKNVLLSNLRYQKQNKESAITTN